MLECSVAQRDPGHDEAILWIGPAPRRADFDEDGTLNSADFFAFLAAFFNENADFNDSGATDSQDLFDYLGAFFAGCA